MLAELARHEHEVMDYRTLLHRVWGPAYGDERHYLAFSSSGCGSNWNTIRRILSYSNSAGPRLSPRSSGQALIGVALRLCRAKPLVGTATTGRSERRRTWAATLPLISATSHGRLAVPMMISSAWCLWAA